MEFKLKKAFKKIKLLILDVDGVLTKGEIIYDDTGRELKIFNVKDGLGIFLLSNVGVKTILLSARNSPMLQKRAHDMGVSEVIAGVLPKEDALNNIKKKYCVEDDAICFVGDDLIDIGIMRRVGLPIAVRDALSVVKKTAVYITKKNGGEGAVREVVDLIIDAQNLQDKINHFLRLKRKK